MIKTIEIKSLKSISELTLNCKNFNLITGVNSSGKSTVLQAILLISQNIGKNCGLNGEIVSLGEFRDVRNFNIKSDHIYIKLVDHRDYDIVLRISDDDIQLERAYEYFTTFADYINLSSGRFHYLSYQRIGHQDAYPKNLTSVDNIGFNGEYAMHYLMKHKDDVMEDALIMDNDKYTLDRQVDYWLRHIVNATVMTEDIVGTDILKAYYTLVDGKKTRPKNVGSGIGYIISIIIMCLASKKDDIIVLENPEIHLHPMAQSKVCQFLYFIAKSGRQLFVETHSDHLFNGLRAGIASGEMDMENICVNYFSLDENNCTESTEIRFGKRGKVLNHSNGLFDQFDIDLNKMLEL